MKKHYLAVLFLASAMLFVGPALSESPPTTIEIRDANVRRLLLSRNCANCDLVAVDLSNAHLIGADLRRADLTGANLTGANLEGADLTGATLIGANLTDAFLTNASFTNANLDNINFSNAQLYHVDVTGASMNNLNLANATVVGTPISIGGGTGGSIYDGAESLTEEKLPILTPEETWQVPPPSSPEIWPHEHPHNFIDIPVQFNPSV